jgi:hypothetical protein
MTVIVFAIKYPLRSKITVFVVPAIILRSATECLKTSIWVCALFFITISNAKNTVSSRNTMIQMRMPPGGYKKLDLS